MNLLYVCKSLPHRFQGGIQSHVWKLSEWMIRRGHNITILTAGSLRRGERRYELEGRQVVELPYLPGRKLPFVSLWGEEWAFNRAADKWLLRYAADFDIVHAQGRSGFLFAGKQGETPLITTIHGLVSVENAQSGRTGAASNWATRQHEIWATMFEKNAMHNSNHIIAVSEPLLEHMKNLVPTIENKTAIIPNGIDIPQNTENTEGSIEDAKQLLFVGRLDPIKGIFPLIEAMKRVNSDVHLVMVGEGPSRGELEKRIAENGLQHRVALVGAQSAAQVQGWMSASLALVLPSFYESLPMVIMEANSCGKPVIASDTGGIPTLVQHGKNGWLVPVNQPSILARAIDELFDNPKRARLMGETGRQIMHDNFSWAHVAHLTDEIYQTARSQQLAFQ